MNERPLYVAPPEHLRMLWRVQPPLHGAALDAEVHWRWRFRKKQLDELRERRKFAAEALG